MIMKFYSKKGGDSSQKKPVGNIPLACVKESKAYTKAYCKGKQNLKK